MKIMFDETFYKIYVLLFKDKTEHDFRLLSRIVLIFVLCNLKFYLSAQCDQSFCPGFTYNYSRDYIGAVTHISSFSVVGGWVESSTEQSITVRWYTYSTTGSVTLSGPDVDGNIHTFSMDLCAYSGAFTPIEIYDNVGNVHNNVLNMMDEYQLYVNHDVASMIAVEWGIYKESISSTSLIALIGNGKNISFKPGDYMSDFERLYSNDELGLPFNVLLKPEFTACPGALTEQVMPITITPEPFMVPDVPDVAYDLTTTCATSSEVKLYIPYVSLYGTTYSNDKLFFQGVEHQSHSLKDTEKIRIYSSLQTKCGNFLLSEASNPQR